MCTMSFVFRLLTGKSMYSTVAMRGSLPHLATIQIKLHTYLHEDDIYCKVCSCIRVDSVSDDPYTFCGSHNSMGSTNIQMILICNIAITIIMLVTVLLDIILPTALPTRDMDC